MDTRERKRVSFPRREEKEKGDANGEKMTTEIGNQSAQDAAMSEGTWVREKVSKKSFDVSHFLVRRSGKGKGSSSGDTTVWRQQHCRKEKAHLRKGGVSTLSTGGRLWREVS